MEWNEIVGNDEAKDRLKSAIDMLFLYDPPTKRNPILQQGGHFPRSIVLHGNPGSGKTSALKAAISHAKTLALSTGKPLWFQDLRECVKEGRVAESVDLYINEATSPERINVLLADDVDALNSRKPGFTAGGSSIIEYFLGRLEESKPYRGNWIVLYTTKNFQELEPAIRERISTLPVRCHGPQTIEHYIQIARVVADKSLEAGDLEVSQEEWTQIGALCCAYELTTLQVQTAIRKVLTDNLSALTCKNIIEQLKLDFDGRV